MDSNHQHLSVGDRASGKVFIRCDRKSALRVAQSSQCTNGAWNPPIPDCTCLPLNGSEIPAICSFDGYGQTSCSAPSQPGITANLACPSRYFKTEQSLVCADDGVWRALGPETNKCRQQCGSGEGLRSRWQLIVTNKKTDQSQCFANALNSVYALTHTDCVNGYEAYELYLWTSENSYSVQSFENGGIFTLIRTKSPFVFSEGRMPICLDDGKGAYKNTWTSGAFDPIPSCNINKLDENGEYVGAKCLVNGTHCIYGYGSAQHQPSQSEIEGIHRRYLYGIVERATRAGEDKDGLYDCNTNKGTLFDESAYVELDFLDYSPRSV